MIVKGDESENLKFKKKCILYLSLSVIVERYRKVLFNDFTRLY